MTQLPRLKFDDLSQICEDKIREDTFLEFKSGEILNGENAQKELDDISKEIVALCNAGGGRLIIGIEEKDGFAENIDPVTNQKRTASWAFQALSLRIRPWIDNLSIYEIDLPEEGFALVADVPQSTGKAHQASDNKFYSRRGEHKMPMLPFEIDDVRRRVLAKTSEVRLAVRVHDGIFRVDIINESDEPFFNVSLSGINIETLTLIDGWSPSLSAPYTRPFRRLEVGETKRCLLNDSDYLESLVHDEAVELKVSYFNEIQEFREQRITFFIHDYRTVKHVDPLEEAISNGFKGISRALESLKSIETSLEKFVGEAVEPSGIVLSRSMVASLNSKTQEKRDPEFLSFYALSNILDIDLDMAFEVHRQVFGYVHLLGGKKTPLRDIELPEDVKEKIMARLKLPAWMLE